MNIFQLIRSYGRDQSGATAIEFALISVAFFMLVFGIVQASHMIWVYNAVRNAAEVTSREALVNEDLTEAELEAVGRDALEGYRVSPDPLSLQRSEVTHGGVEFNELNVSYEYSPFVIAFLPAALADVTFTVTVSRPHNWGDE